MQWRLSTFSTVFLSFLLGGMKPCFALDVIPLYSSQQYTSLGGCCQSAPTRDGVAGILRMDVGDFGTWDVYGMSDTKWNEISLLKPVYLIGKPITFDPTMDGITKVRRVPRYTLIWSYGGGFFTHNTRTTRLDLAALVTGINLLNHLEFQYSLADNLSFVAIARAGAAFSFDDRGIVIAPVFGLLWRP
jgi:hypothetical protein